MNQMYFFTFLSFSLEHSSKKEKLVLNLSTNSLTSKTCAVLGKIIAADHAFMEYKFADCMLSEDGKYYKSELLIP